MMDIFTEHIVKHKTGAIDWIIKIAAVILAVVLTLLATLLFSIPQISFLVTLIIAGIWYGAYWLIRSRNIEYEYAMTNSYLDIDKIIARSKRKRIASIDFKEIELCAAIDDENHKHEYNATEGIEKVLDCTGDGRTDVYFIDFTDEKGKRRILFQPTSKMMEDACKFNPRKIFVKN